MYYAVHKNVDVKDQLLSSVQVARSADGTGHSKIVETLAATRQDMKLLPHISIITPSLNQGMFIGEALESIRLQNYPKVEHLVIDGCSTDNTVDLLRNWEFGGENCKVKWTSKRDGGQSEALNEGFRRAKGEIVGWLNADDRYRPGCFGKIAKAFADYPDIDVFFGDYVLVDECGETIQARREIEFNRFILWHNRVLYIATTATFFRRRIFEEGNRLDENLHYAMDLDFFLRLTERGYRFKHIPEVLADYRLQPDSKTCSAPDLQKKEHRYAVMNNSPNLDRILPKVLRQSAILLLGSIAAVERYTEKLFRGYYHKHLQPNGDKLQGELRL
jgi:glycosyltransferase involved in cell wall biosynthesis